MKRRREIIHSLFCINRFIGERHIRFELMTSVLNSALPTELVSHQYKGNFKVKHHITRKSNLWAKLHQAKKTKQHNTLTICFVSKTSTTNTNTNTNMYTKNKINQRSINKNKHPKKILHRNREFFLNTPVSTKVTFSRIFTNNMQPQFHGVSEK